MQLNHRPNPSYEHAVHFPCSYSLQHSFLLSQLFNGVFSKPAAALLPSLCLTPLFIGLRSEKTQSWPNAHFVLGSWQLDTLLHCQCHGNSVSAACIITEGHEFQGTNCKPRSNGHHVSKTWTDSKHLTENRSWMSFLNGEGPSCV